MAARLAFPLDGFSALDFPSLRWISSVLVIGAGRDGTGRALFIIFAFSIGYWSFWSPIHTAGQREKAFTGPTKPFWGTGETILKHVGIKCGANEWR